MNIIESYLIGKLIGEHVLARREQMRRNDAIFAKQYRDPMNPADKQNPNKMDMPHSKAFKLFFNVR